MKKKLKPMFCVVVVVTPFSSSSSSKSPQWIEKELLSPTTNNNSQLPNTNTHTKQHNETHTLSLFNTVVVANYFIFFFWRFVT